MPSYNTINTPIQQGVPGLPAYLLGSFDYGAATGHFVITNVARTAFTCTVTVTVLEGNLPVVNQLVSVLCSNSTFNVDQVALSAVSFNAATGVGTITYTGTTFGEIVSVAATGRVKALVPEVGESLTSNLKSGALSLQANTGPNNGQDVRFEISVTSNPAVTITCEAAENNIDSEFNTITNTGSGGTGVGATGSFTVSSAGTQQFTAVDLRARFVRFKCGTVVGGTSPTIVGRVLV